VLFLTGIALSHYTIIWSGKEIRLQTAPLDPRDLLYGDYVVLNYEINRLRPELWKETGELPKRGSPVYVVLKQGQGESGTYEAEGVYSRKPPTQEGQIILKGRADYSDTEAIFVKYGLETYYVAENTGRELEQAAARGQLIAKVKVGPSGDAVLEGLEELK
jgi:uncharacterized membrane-anchored protein